jgi:hypothetical protein
MEDLGPRGKRKNFKAFVLQDLLILTAPVSIDATVYMTLGRVIRALDAEHHGSIRTKWITTIFVLADVLCFCTQLGGAGIQITGEPKAVEIGKEVVLAGLIFKIVVFCFYVYTAGMFHARFESRADIDIQLRPMETAHVSTLHLEWLYPGSKFSQGR